MDSHVDTNLKQQLVTSHQYLHSLNPETLLPIDLAAPLLNKSASTLRTDITRRPGALPVFVRFGRRVFFIKKDIDSFISASRCTQPALVVAALPSRKRGRPTKTEQLARARNAQQREPRTVDLLTGHADVGVRNA